MTTHESLSVAILGSGGNGAITTGTVLLDAAARAGRYGLMTRAVGPQIRGGESAALLRLGDRPLGCHDDRFDLVLALDFAKAERFVPHVPMDRATLLVASDGAGAVPEALTRGRPRVVELPLASTAKDIEGGRANSVALGFLAAEVGLPLDALFAALDEKLERKGAPVVEAARACVRAGAALSDKPAGAAVAARSRTFATGNQLTGLGALRGGLRFSAGYPITPSTDLLEWLAPRLADLGGAFVQAEDELAAIHMALGAAFGGTPAMTATSGPGLSLMVEALGLAVAAEIPVLVVDVQRGGPSTGLPTGTEQGDLWIAVHGLHGDAPHLVVAPSGPHDLASTAEWGMRLAEALQTPTLLLSDQFLGQALTVVDEPLRAPAVAEGRRPTSNGAYERYALTASGVSPRALPGTAGQAYTATGLSKTEGAVPSGAPEDHAAQLEKRFQKLQRFDYGDFWGSVEGDPEAPTAILTWGSPAGAAREASQRLASEGVPVRVVVPRLLSPLPVRQLGEALRGVERLVVLEQTHGGQFFRYVRSEMALPGEVTSLRRPGPLSFRPGEIVDILRPSAVTPTAQLPLGSAS